jgi:2-haloacid dehalogenase
VPRVILFDVNETMLDLAALDPLFEDRFGTRETRREWFDQTLQSAMVGTITGEYTDFGAVGMAALAMVAARHGVALSDGDREALRAGMRSLPPHPEVRTSLERLRDAGFRLAALGNSTAEVIEAQLASAGLRDLFEQVFSADAVRRLKPAPEPYLMAAGQLGVAIDRVRLVAAHAWDIAGAQRAGAAAGFIARPGRVLDPLVPAPNVSGSDLSEVVDRIIAIEGEEGAAPVP